jgi:general secretion pathway protein K
MVIPQVGLISMAEVRLQKGVALLAALILMLALISSLSLVFYRHQLDVARAARAFHGEQAQLLALSVENWASQLLSSQRDDRTIDTLEENWARAVPVLPVEGGYISGCLRDLQGAFNLNSFMAYDGQRWSEEMGEPDTDEPVQSGFIKIWLALLQQSGLPANEAQAASIVDWIDADQVQINQWGAEQTDYDFERTRRMVPNSPLTDVGELAVIRGYDAQMLALLHPMLSALPRVTTININTAAPALLRALGGHLASDFAEFVGNTRPFLSLEDFHTRAGAHFKLDAATVAAAWPALLVDVKSDYFQLDLRVSLGTVMLEISSVIDRSGLEEPRVLRRTLQPVPVTAAEQLSVEEALNLQDVCMPRPGVSS